MFLAVIAATHVHQHGRHETPTHIDHAYCRGSIVWAIAVELLTLDNRLITVPISQ
uniref:Uncharacterized protein n=1 Tax=Amphimedon queenslandica TaxID=400682 RepID=A0A1X7SV66_AMPQE